MRPPEPPDAASTGDGKMIEIGFHTDAFNSSYWSFEKCLEWAQKNDLHWIECGTIDCDSWLESLGYQPHVSMSHDPMIPLGRSSLGQLARA